MAWMRITKMQWDNNAQQVTSAFGHFSIIEMGNAKPRNCEQLHTEKRNGKFDMTYDKFA